MHVLTTPPEDRATAIGRVTRPRNSGEDRTSSFEDMIVDIQTYRQTDRHAHHNTPLPCGGGGVINGDGRCGRLQTIKANSLQPMAVSLV